MPSWPSALPQLPLADGFGVAPEPNVIDFTSEVGVEHSRRRSTAPREIFSATFLLTKDQAKRFRSWFAIDLVDGTLTYTWQDPFDEVEGTYKIRSHSFARRGAHWLLSMQLRRLG